VSQVFPTPKRDPLRPARLLAASITMALVVSGAVLWQADRRLDRLEGWVERGSAAPVSPRAEAALASWVRPWIETYLRERDLPSKAADPLEHCARELLLALDPLSESANVVRHRSIEGAGNEAVFCARPPLGSQHAVGFVQAIRARWGLWLQEEYGVEQAVTDDAPPGIRRVAPAPLLFGAER
jgi:hypothetical protein